MVCARMEIDARRERLEDALRRCAACGEIRAPPMHVHHLCFAYWRAYGVQRCFYADERAVARPASAKIDREVPAISDAVLARLGHFYG